MTECRSLIVHPPEEGHSPLSNHFLRQPSWIAGVQHFKYRSRLVYPDHAHNETCVIVCMAGDLESVQAGVREVLKPGDVIITNRNTIHSARYGVDGEACEGLMLDVGTSTYLSILRDLAISFPTSVEACVFLGKIHMPHIAAMAKDLAQAVGLERQGSAYDENNLIQKILVDVIRAWPRRLIRPVFYKAEPRLHAWDFVRCVQLMTLSGREQFLVKSLYEELDLAASTFYELFRNTAGLTALQLFHRILISRACRMLEDESASVKEIAYGLDFRSVSHFSRLFKIVTGISPNTYRTQKARGACELAGLIGLSVI